MLISEKGLKLIYQNIDTINLDLNNNMNETQNLKKLMRYI